MTLNQVDIILISRLETAGLAYTWWRKERKEEAIVIGVFTHVSILSILCSLTMKLRGNWGASVLDISINAFRTNINQILDDQHAALKAIETLKYDAIQSSSYSFFSMLYVFPVSFQKPFTLSLCSNST